MVDTLLTADAMVVVRDALADVLIVASDDDDMIPALLSLEASGVKGIRMRRKRLGDDYYDGILDMQGLHTHTW